MSHRLGENLSNMPPLTVWPNVITVATLSILLYFLQSNPAMPIGSMYCGELMPITLESYTSQSKSIFTAKVISGTDVGEIKLRTGELVEYYILEIVIDEVLKSSWRPIESSRRTKAVIVEENLSGHPSTLSSSYYDGYKVLFMMDMDRYTISGDREYDREVMKIIESRLKIPLRDRKYIVALPCESLFYKYILGYPRDIVNEIRGYIRSER